jgi:LacI family transcriptional regulator
LNDPSDPPDPDPRHVPGLRPIRMKDIAERLGLSQTTVSHVLTGKHAKFRISAATVERVWELARKLGYRTNAMAQAFREQKSYAISLAVEDLANPFWAGIAVGAEREAELHGYALVVSHLAGNAGRQRRALQLVHDSRVDGLIVSPVFGGDCDLIAAHEQGLPFVQIDRAVPDLDVACVRTDHAAGSVLALHHLLRHKDRSLVYIGGPLDIPTYRHRLDGFRAELTRSGVEAAAIEELKEATPEAAETRMVELLQRLRGPLAVYAANFWSTVGTLRGIRAAGLSVPDEIDVVGFDDILMADLLRYPVATVDQDVGGIGREAVRLLLKRLAGAEVAREVLLPPRLTARTSDVPPGERRARAPRADRSPDQPRRSESGGPGKNKKPI